MSLRFDRRIHEGRVGLHPMAAASRPAYCVQVAGVEKPLMMNDQAQKRSRNRFGRRLTSHEALGET